MRKIIIIGFLVVLIVGAFTGCQNDGEIPPADTTTSKTSVTTEPIAPEPGTVSLDDVVIDFPIEFTVRTGEADGDYRFQRQYRFSYYGLTSVASRIDSVSREALHEWGLNELEQNNEVEPTEPRILSFIKKFNIAFDEFERETKNVFLFRLRMNNNMSDEEYEIPNPYLLYTFNLERINDYYSLDSARHTSAVQWLEEWLCTNQPYASYSTFRSANPQ